MSRTITPDELKKLFPGASKDTLKLNSGVADAAAQPGTVTKRLTQQPISMAAPVARPVCNPGTPKEKFKLNKTEQRYLSLLQAVRAQKISLGEVWGEIRPQAIVLELGEGCRYRPDFSAVVNGRLTFWEVKGAWVYAEGKVKYKVAPRLWPEFDFHLAQWKDGKWTETKLLP